MSARSVRDPRAAMRYTGEMTLLEDANGVVAAAAKLGLLFVSDPKRESAVHVLTGEHPRGSWWSHPNANDIYDILKTLERHPDLLFAKLLAGKVTIIHRALWPAFLTVVTAREDWQVEGLSPGGTQALAALDQADATGADVPEISRTIGKEIESRLLAHAESVHAPAGKHVTRLQTWKTWARAAGCPYPTSPSQGTAVAEAKQVLERAAARLADVSALPWAT